MLLDEAAFVSPELSGLPACHLLPVLQPQALGFTSHTRKSFLSPLLREAGLERHRSCQVT